MPRMPKKKKTEEEAEEAFPPPYAHDLFFGHQKSEQHMLDALRSDRLHHAWLIEGPRGLGKATLAWRAARFLLADGASLGAGLAIDKKSAVWHLTLAMSHPDFLSVAPAAEQKTATITVDNVRAVQSFFSKSPALGRYRLCIIDAADNLNLNAANALLKLLEEPPDHAVFFLICHHPGRLLATIRSRCRRLKLAPLPDLEVERVVKTFMPQIKKPDMDIAIRVAHGCPGRALAFAEGQGLKLYRDLRKLVAALPQMDFPAVQSFCASLSDKEQKKYDLFCDLMLDWIASGTRSQVSQSAQLDEGLKLWGKVSEIIQTRQRLNMDRSEAAMNIFLALEAAR